MKKTTKMALSLAILAIITIFYTNLSIAATITKPRKEDPNASIHVRGITTYYNWDNQAWKKYSYRPAAYGNILEFYTVRKNRI